MLNNQEVNLYTTTKTGNFQVLSVPDIGMLENIGVRNGTQISVKHRYSLGGPVLMRVEGAYTVAIGKDIAEHISVCEVELSEADVSEVVASEADVSEVVASEADVSEVVASEADVSEVVSSVAVVSAATASEAVTSGADTSEVKAGEAI